MPRFHIGALPTPALLIAWGLAAVSATAGAAVTGALSSLEAEALGRVAAVIRTYTTPFETIELVAEMDARNEGRPVTAQQVLADHYPEGALSSAEYREIRDRLQEELARPRTRRFVLYLAPEGLYRYERISEVLNVSDLSRLPNLPIDIVRHTVIQGPLRNWYVDEHDRWVRITDRHVAPGEAFPILQTGWSELDHFVEFPSLVDLFRQIREVRVEVTGPGDQRTATAQLVAPGILPGEIQFGFRESHDAVELADWVLFRDPNASMARLWELSEWQESGGLHRPRRVEMTLWRGSASSLPIQALKTTPASRHFTLTASRLAFNAPIPPSVFDYTPPSDYRRLEETSPGVYQVVYDPAAPPISHLSARERRLQERLQQASWSSRAVRNLAIGGGIFLVAAILFWARSRRPA